jgi:hypothetical protein
MRTLPFLFLIAATSACSPYSPDLGGAPVLCGSAEPKCPDGYTCMAGSGGSPDVCLAPNGAVPVDGSSGDCADDSMLEPNNTIATAWQTPVDSPKKVFPLGSLAICPAGDKDTYAVNISTANETLEVLAEFDPARATLQGSILNSGGIPIANASPVAGMTGQIHAAAANLPKGTYYAQIYGPSSGAVTTNNYKLTLTVTP